MLSTVSHRIANLLIWIGLLLIIIGCALMYPFVRDTIEAQSDPAVTLSFVVTLTPVPDVPTVMSVIPTPTPAPQPAATASPLPVSASITHDTSALTATSGIALAPVVLPDDSSSSDQTISPLATVPASSVVGSPPDRIVIPAIGLDAPVDMVGWHIEQGFSVWDVPDRRVAGWLKTSAPAGQPGNTVLDGHHNIRGEVFRRLVDLKPGDAIELYASGVVYHYAVTEKHILLDRGQPLEVRIANAQWIQPTNDERLTLVTCWPYTNNTHRLIIVARPVSSLSNRGLEEGRSK